MILINWLIWSAATIALVVEIAGTMLPATLVVSSSGWNGIEYVKHLRLVAANTNLHASSLSFSKLDLIPFDDFINLTNES